VLWTPDKLKTAPSPPTVLSSKEFDNTTNWVPTGSITTTADAAANPINGTVDADKLMSSAGTTSPRNLIQSGLSFVEGFEYTLSVYVKNDNLASSKNIILSFGTTCFDEDWAIFDIYNGDLVQEYGGSSPSGQSNVTDIGGGWFKYEFSLVATATGTDEVAIGFAGNTSAYRPSHFLSSGQGAFFYNAQVTCNSILTRWYDSSDSSTITLDGSTVTTWTDKSTNAATATQSGATSLKPAYVTGLLNGLAGIRADGVDDYLRETGSFALTSIQVYCLHRSLDWITDTSKARNLWHTDFGQTNANEGLRVENYINSQTVRIAPESVSSGATFITETALNNPNFVNLQRVTYDRRADTIQTELNSDEVIAATVTTSEPASFGSSLTLFVGFSLVATPTRYDYDEMFEFVVFSVPLPTTLADKYEGYVMHKFGSADRLPVDHTYKTQPPYIS
jgi:hypothetical protein